MHDPSHLLEVPRKLPRTALSRGISQFGRIENSYIASCDFFEGLICQFGKNILGIAKLFVPRSLVGKLREEPLSNSVLLIR